MYARSIRKKKTDYSKTVIYKIQCKDPNIGQTYGGHSVDLEERTGQHFRAATRESNEHHNRFVYQFIRENGGWDNWEVVWQYDYPCENKREAEIEETRFIKKNNCELNSQMPYRTEEEKAEYMAKYYEEHKERYVELKAEWYKKNKEEHNQQGAENYKKRIEKETPEEKKRLENNRIKSAQRVKCEICNIEIRAGYVHRHNKTQTHLKNLEEFNKKNNAELKII